MAVGDRTPWVIRNTQGLGRHVWSLVNTDNTHNQRSTAVPSFIDDLMADPEGTLRKVDGAMKEQHRQSLHASVSSRLNRLAEIWDEETVDDYAVQQILKSVRKLLDRTHHLDVSPTVIEAITPMFDGLQKTMMSLEEIGTYRRAHLETLGLREQRIMSDDTLKQYRQYGPPVNVNNENRA